MNNQHSGPLASAVRAILLAASGFAPVTAVDAQQSPSDASNIEEVIVYGKAELYRPTDQTTATGLQMALIDTPQSISVISSEMMKLFNKQSAYNAVDMVPGAAQAGSGFGVQRISLRGQLLTEPRINNINLASSQFVDSFALERLEVVKGPATVIYGITGGFGGELNQILKAPTSQVHASLGYQGGDFSLHRFEADVGGPIPGTDDKLKVRLVGAYTNYGIPQDLVVPARNTAKFGTASIAYDFSQATTLSVYLYKEVKSFDPTDGCPLAQNADGQIYIPTQIPVNRWYCNDPYYGNTYTSTSFEIADLRHTFSNDWTVDAKVANSHSHHTLDYVYGVGPAGAYSLAPTDVYLYSYQSDSADNVVTSALSLGGNFSAFERTQQFLVALQYQREERNGYNAPSLGLGVMNMFRDGGLGILNDGSRIPGVPPPVFNTNHYALYRPLIGSFQLLLNPINRVDVLAGVLVQRISLESDTLRLTDPSKSKYAQMNETDTIPRVAVTYGLLPSKGDRLTDAKAYFNYSEGYEPNVAIYGLNGDPLTAPQRMKSFEVGLKTSWLKGSLDATVDVFDSSVTNVPSQYYAPGVGSERYYTLNGENKYRGVEFSLLGEALPGWNVDLNYSYINTEVQSGLVPVALRVANVPKQQAAFYTSYEFLAGPLKGLIVGGAVVVKDDVPLFDNAAAFGLGHWSFNNQVPWSATRVDFRASYKFHGALKGLELWADVFNAFDSRSYFSMQGTPGFSNTVGPPRTITAGLRYSL
jgi:iron complex outermembrane receptor protein